MMATLSVLLLLLLAGVAVGLPMPRSTSNDEALPRMRRRVGDLNITSTPHEYMRKLFEEYADEDGKPKHDGTKPTDAWCFPDKDVAKQEYREKPHNNAKCATYTQYMFQWSSLSDTLLEKDFDVQNAILRAYIQIIPRHVGEGENISVSLSVAMNPGNANDTGNVTSGVFAGQKEISVARGSNQWVELNVTEGIRAVWPLVRSTSEVQVIIKAEVNCVSQKKVPFNFINPAEIPLDQDKRRERHLDLQPYLVVFADNEITKRQLMQPPPDDAIGEGNDDILDLIDGRVKRSSSLDHCSISNYSVNLHDLGLTYVLAPLRVNIFKCSGPCSHSILRRNSYLGTNHAKIMASIHLAQHSQNPTFTGMPAPSPPCCVPTDYEVVYLFLQTPDSTSSEVRGYSNFKAKRCGCR